MPRRAFFVLILIAYAAAAGGTPQAPARAPRASIQHEVSVTLKLIQVFVTDAKGKPALGLERSDFTLYDNGALQTITDFESHVLTVPAAGRLEPTPAPAPAPAPLLSRKFFFIVDYVRNDLEGVMKARNAVLEFLDKTIRPGDEVSLYTLSSVSGLTLHEYLTADHDKLRRRLKKLRDAPGITPVGGQSTGAEEPMGMELMNAEIFGRHGGHSGTGNRNHFAEIAAWAKSLRTVPGQKNVILFSRGFGGAVIRPGDSGNSLFRLMARELATANAPVFTVNTTTGVADKIAQGVFPELSLDALSQMTGGRHFPDVNFYARIADDIRDATTNYYVLGYYVPEAWDGKFHEVKVEVAKKGYAIHAQRGYFNPVPFAELSPVEKHLKLIEVALGVTASEARDMDFPMTAVPFGAGPTVEVLLLSELSVPAVRAAVGDRTEIISLILDENKAIVDGKRAEIDWAGLRPGTVYEYAAAGLVPGRYECRTVVRNLDNGKAAVGACAVDVAAAAAEGPSILPPLLLVRGAGAQYLNLAETGISSAVPFLGNEYVPLVGELEPGATSLWAALKCLWRGERGGDKGLSATLRPEGSDEEIELAAELLTASSAEDADLYLLAFELPPLPPGRYRLVIRATDDETGAKTATASAWFSVRGPQNTRPTPTLRTTRPDL